MQKQSSPGGTRRVAGLVVTPDLLFRRRLGGAVARDVEQRSTAHHLDRLRQGRVESREPTALHLDTHYGLKEINSLLVEIAYPLLESEGQLRDNWLRGDARVTT